MKKYLKKHLPSALLGAAALIVMWLCWWIAEICIKNEYLLPSFSETLSALGKVLTEGLFWRALFKTLLKTLWAFLISFVLAGFCAALGRILKNFDMFLKPIIAVLRTLPTMAVLVLILFYADKITAPVIVAVLVLFPMIYAQFNVAFNRIDADIVAAVKVFNLTRRQKLFKVYLPMIAPSVLSSTGSNISFGIKLIISAEVMAYSYTSIGGMMQYAAGTLFDIPRLAALTLVAIILGLMVELVFYFALKFAFKWDKSEAKDD